MVKKIPESIFIEIKNNVPLSCVDIILKNDKNEFLLVKRSIEPYKNKWCLPGGIVKRGEKLENKIKEIGFEPKIDLDDGLKQTIDWYVSNLS